MELFGLGSTTIGIVVAIIVLAVTLFVLRSRKGGGGIVSKGNTIVFVGLMNSGKTVLFEQLRDGIFVETHTSMKENSDTFAIHATKQSGESNKEYTFVDIPGNYRVRARITEFLPSTRKIVFVVDSTEIDNEIRSIAQYLFELLTNKTVNRKRIPFLIACNKQDMSTSRDKEFIKVQLEKEIDKLRKTARSIPDQSEDGDEVILGVVGQTFKWDQLDNEVSFEELSAKTGNIKSVIDFISNQ